jgi:hypothetical protein
MRPFSIATIAGNNSNGKEFSNQYFVPLSLGLPWNLPFLGFCECQAYQVYLISQIFLGLGC